MRLFIISVCLALTFLEVKGGLGYGLRSKHGKERSHNRRPMYNFLKHSSNVRPRYSKPFEPRCLRDCPTCPKIAKTPEKTYLLHFSSVAVGGHEYRDPVTGEFKGLAYDIVEKVCEAAGIKCETVFGGIQDCITSLDNGLQVGGEGLQAGWVDACVNWAPSTQRRSFFAFSESFIEPRGSFLFVKPGNPSHLDPNDVTGKKIGFVDGLIHSPDCLKNAGVVGVDEGIVLFNDQDLMLEALTNGNIDGMFLRLETDLAGAEIIGDNRQCITEGPAIVAKKNNEIIELFNKGLAIIKANGMFQEICDQAVIDHGAQGFVECLLL